jgi:hypothetical protein
MAIGAPNVGIVADLEGSLEDITRFLGEAESADNLRNFGRPPQEALDRAKQMIDAAQEAIGSVLGSLAERMAVYCEHLHLPATRSRLLEWLSRWPETTRGGTNECHTENYDGRECPAFDELEPIIQAILAHS